MAGAALPTDAQVYAAQYRGEQPLQWSTGGLLLFPGLVSRGSKELMQTFPAFPLRVSLGHNLGSLL